MTRPVQETAGNTLPAGRVVLRELRADQARDIVAGRQLPDQAWADGYPLEGTVDAARMLVRALDAGGYRAGFGMYQIVDAETGTVIGDVGFHGAPDESGVVEIGYGLVPAHRGRGLVTDAVRALVGWALAQPGVREVCAETEPDHLPSQGVLRRTGFTEEPAGGSMRHYVLRAAGSVTG